MRIISLELENIKSYAAPTRIELTTGLNAVCGLNGSGKTTVLEAIGFALFDYLPYNRQAFVREGEKTGTVRLRLLAGDEREYEIVRKVGSSGQYYVADLETGTRLADRAENVLDWVRTHALGIDVPVDLESLFQNAVGVPQGTMTSDFLRAATQRKNIFDPLLRVEEYRAAYDNLRDTMTYLRERAGQLREEIARLEETTADLPDWQERATEMRRQAEESERLLAANVAELERLNAQKGELDARE